MLFYKHVAFINVYMSKPGRRLRFSRCEFGGYDNIYLFLCRTHAWHPILDAFFPLLTEVFVSIFRISGLISYLGTCMCLIEKDSTSTRVQNMTGEMTLFPVMYNYLNSCSLAVSFSDLMGLWVSVLELFKHIPHDCNKLPHVLSLLHFL